MKSKLIVALLCSVFALPVQAQQLFANPPKNEIIDTKQPTTTETINQQVAAPLPPTAAPTEMTAEQKILIQRDLRKNIQNVAVNSSPKERKALLKAVETIEKMRIRQENVGKPIEEQVKFEKVNVNIHDRKDFQNYLQKIFIDDAEDRLKKLTQPKEEDITSEETTANQENTENE